MKTNYKILIVDDDAIIRRLYHRILTLKGYSVSTTDTAVGIFYTISEHDPDIVLMDSQMPMVSGSEAIKQLKSIEVFRSIPVIMFSSVNNLDVVAKEAGADAYVSKLGTNEELFEVVQDMIKRLPAHQYSRVR